MRPLIIGTRGSALALCQTRTVQAKLEERSPATTFTIRTVQAQADKDPELPLAKMGGEGVFVKELEAALLEKRVDLAVHSLKDLPLDTPPGLRIAAILEREEPRDAFVSASGAMFDEMPTGSRIGTSSLRRQSQLLSTRQDIEVVEMRGNVDTRLRKLDEGRYDAIVLAACGLIRLGLNDRITEYLGIEQMVPEPGQGALAIEARADDREVLELLASLDDPESRACTEAERSFLRALGGGCRVPIAAFASIQHGTIMLLGRVVSPDGAAKAEDAVEGLVTEPVALGQRLADRLIDQGARDILNQTNDLS